MPSWLAIVGLILCFPVGIVLTLLTRWSTPAKAIAIGVVVALAVVGGIVSVATSGNGIKTASLTQASPAANQNTQQASAAPTAKPTSTPTLKPTSSPSPKQTFKTFGDGTFIVGTEVQAGTYRTRRDSSGCYFARLKGFGGSLDDIIANENTDSIAVVTIAPSDKGFQSDGCGTWTSDLSQVTSSKTSFGDGDLIVGVDITPGTYRNSASTGCYYARLRGFGHSLDDIIANNNTDSQAIVTIAATDRGFESNRCGTWNKV